MKRIVAVQCDGLLEGSSKNRYGGVRPKDLKTWENITDLLSFPKDARHGTMFEVDVEIVVGIKK